MKKLPFILICFALALINTVSALGQATTTHEITLRVDTANFNRQNPEASCEFVAGENTEVLVASPASEFTIVAEVGDTIHWRGVSSSGEGVTVDIKKIKYALGVNLFPVDEMDGIDMVQGTITKGNQGDDYKYVISFKIGDSGAVYRIDPKIQVK